MSSYPAYTKSIPYYLAYPDNSRFFGTAGRNLPSYVSSANNEYAYLNLRNKTIPHQINSGFISYPFMPTYNEHFSNEETESVPALTDEHTLNLNNINTNFVNNKKNNDDQADKNVNYESLKVEANKNQNNRKSIKRTDSNVNPVKINQKQSQNNRKNNIKKSNDGTENNARTIIGENTSDNGNDGQNIASMNIVNNNEGYSGGNQNGANDNNGEINEANYPNGEKSSGFYSGYSIPIFQKMYPGLRLENYPGIHQNNWINTNSPYPANNYGNIGNFIGHNPYIIHNNFPRPYYKQLIPYPFYIDSNRGSSNDGTDANLNSFKDHEAIAENNNEAYDKNYDGSSENDYNKENNNNEDKSNNMPEEPNSSGNNWGHKFIGNNDYQNNNEEGGHSGGFTSSNNENHGDISLNHHENHHNNNENNNVTYPENPKEDNYPTPMYVPYQNNDEIYVRPIYVPLSYLSNPFWHQGYTWENYPGIHHNNWININSPNPTNSYGNIGDHSYNNPYNSINNHFPHSPIPYNNATNYKNKTQNQHNNGPRPNIPMPFPHVPPFLSHWYANIPHIVDIENGDKDTPEFPGFPGGSNVNVNVNLPFPPEVILPDHLIGGHHNENQHNGGDHIHHGGSYQHTGGENNNEGNNDNNEENHNGGNHNEANHHQQQANYHHGQANHNENHNNGPAHAIDKFVLDKTKPTKIIVHGWLDSSNSKWVHDMAKELKKVDFHNQVVLFDWTVQASNDYAKAASYVKSLGI